MTMFMRKHIKYKPIMWKENLRKPDTSEHRNSLLEN